MTSAKIRTLRVIILVWAVLSFLVALLPEGVGGVPRVLNAVLFMTLGPGCALMSLLMYPPSNRHDRVVDAAEALGDEATMRGPRPPHSTTWSVGLVGVVSIAASLTVLVLGSQLLLMVGLWTVGGVACIVTLATVALVLLSLKKEGR